MARTVTDVALMLSAIAGPDDRCPIALGEPGETFAGAVNGGSVAGLRIAWSRNLGGLPIESAVTDVLDAHRGVFDGLGCRVIDAEPDFTGAEEAFTTWRAWMFEALLGPHLDAHREQLGPNVILNIEEGRALTGHDLSCAERARTRLYHRIRGFMNDYDFLAAPVTQVCPFPVTEDYPRRVAGVEMHTYLDWIKSCYYVSVTGLPSISVPCGFTAQGLPVGLQIVGRHHDELGVLRLAHAFERETEYWRRHPEPVTP
jgi:amidase